MKNADIRTVTMGMRHGLRFPVCPVSASRSRFCFYAVVLRFSDCSNIFHVGLLRRTSLLDQTKVPTSFRVVLLLNGWRRQELHVGPCRQKKEHKTCLRTAPEKWQDALDGNQSR